VVVHAGVFPAPPERCYRTARRLDLLGDPVIRTLLRIRSLPQRFADRLAGEGDATAATSQTFGLDDMVRYGWILLGEDPNLEVAFGQIGRPWKAVGASSGPAVTQGGFAGFDRPGFAKIAFALRVDPHGATSSILTMETRVALTDAESRRRFRRYWRLVRPFVALIDRMALRLLTEELGAVGYRRTADR